MKKHHIIIICILLVAILAGIFSYPRYWNQGVDFLNMRFNLNLPHFWEKPFQLGLDLQGGAHLVYQADLREIEPAERTEVMEGLRDIMERRIDLFGIREPRVVVKGERLIIELPGVIEVREAIRMIGETPFLIFKEQRPEEERQKILSKQEEIRNLIGKDIWEELTEQEFKKIQTIEDWFLALEDPNFKRTELTGRYLKRARVDFGGPVPQPIISLEFTNEGARIFEELTERNIGKPLAIYIDEILISAPIVREKIIGGRAQISGDFTLEQARELARNLNAGALPVPIELISQQTIGPALGRISLEKSLYAGIIGFLLIVFFLIVVYRFLGIIGIVILGIELAFLLALFKIAEITLNLAGIAGIVLFLGMAVDGNILIFSRIKEELKQGMSLRASIEEGFEKAWTAIKDSNLTTFTIIAILFFIGTGFVVGFALTLGIGILINIFSVLFITRNLLRCCAETRLAKIKSLWG